MPEPGQYEIGIRKGSPDDFLNGRFNQASLKILDKEELRTMPKSDLKLMRNEIFARYGLIFSAGGEMDQYFRQQDWYQGQYTRVDQFLTDIEKENVGLIKEFEGK